MAKEKLCKKCKKPLNRRNKSGFCVQCLPRTGKDNPFYGKRHSEKTKKIIRDKNREISKKLWENDEYRNKVITNATGKKRSDSFKETQRQNAYEQFKDPWQRDIRAEKLKETWELGKIPEIVRYSQNKSEIEKECILFFKDYFGKYCEDRTTLHSNRNDKRWFFPDSVIFNEFIIEFYGDYWHANPEIYYSEDIVHHGLTAKEIWDKDKERENSLENLGYIVIIIWEQEYKDNPYACVKNIILGIDWGEFHC